MDNKTIEHFEIRALHTAEEILQCIELQGTIWGLDELSRMSPITLKAMVSDEPKTGFVFGGFLGGKMVAIQITLPTLEPHTVYGHMLGILKEYRDLRLGSRMQDHLFQTLNTFNVNRMLWTYEPLEGRNAKTYLNKSGGRVIKYLPDYYQVSDEMSGGMPMDRFMVEMHLDDEFYTGRTHHRQPAVSMEEALQTIPVAGPDFLPETDKVLVEIPDDLQKMKASNNEQAVRYRFDTRKIFIEYINNRKFCSEYVYSTVADDRRQSYYLLQKDS